MSSGGVHHGGGGRSFKLLIVYHVFLLNPTVRHFEETNTIIKSGRVRR